MTARGLSLGRAAVPVLAAGLAWGGLCLWLYAEEHQPSAVLLPIPRESYYAWQALFVVPLLVLQHWVLAWAARLLVPGLHWWDACTVTGPAFGLVLLGYVAIDAALFATGGFDALTAAARWLGPAVALVLWTAVAAALRQRTDAGWGRALLASLAGLIAQGIVAAPLLR